MRVSNLHPARLRKHGDDVDDAVHSDSLRVLTAEETYTSGGRFGAERMYELLQSALADAHRPRS